MPTYMACRRYWTLGGSLRNIPVGGTPRRARRASSVNPQWSPFPAAAAVVSGPMPSLMSTEPGAIHALPIESFPHAHSAFMSNSGSLSTVHRMHSVSRLLGLTDSGLTLLGGPTNPYEFSNLMGSDFPLSGEGNLPPSDLLQQQRIHCSQDNYLGGLEMPRSQQVVIEQSLVPPNLHSTGPSMLQQSFNIGNGVLDPEAVLRCGYSNNDMGGPSMVDPIYWSHVPEFGPSV